MKAGSFAVVYRNLCTYLKNAPQVKTERWQGQDVSKNPAATTYERTNVTFEVDLGGIEDLHHWRRDIGPNLPWADDHFEERVSGAPLNPGREWKNWPWATSADKFREGEIFNHTYAERLWPKWPRRGNGGEYPNISGMLRRSPNITTTPTTGIGWTYGDLEDLVQMLVEEPHTRQAYIPLFFPEDTGKGDGGRKPCTLGYHFMVRKGRMNIFYPMRSVDLRRHFRDDCYLAVRLLLWVLSKCRARSTWWADVVPGTYAMWMTSLHVFENDHIILREGGNWDATK
jgi:hypothetical protein